MSGSEALLCPALGMWSRHLLLQKDQGTAVGWFINVLVLSYRERSAEVPQAGLQKRTGKRTMTQQMLWTERSYPPKCSLVLSAMVLGSGAFIHGISALRMDVETASLLLLLLHSSFLSPPLPHSPPLSFSHSLCEDTMRR